MALLWLSPLGKVITFHGRFGFSLKEEIGCFFGWYSFSFFHLYVYMSPSEHIKTRAYGYRMDFFSFDPGKRPKATETRWNLSLISNFGHIRCSLKLEDKNIVSFHVAVSLGVLLSPSEARNGESDVCCACGRSPDPRAFDTNFSFLFFSSRKTRDSFHLLFSVFIIFHLGFSFRVTFYFP